MFTGRYMRSGNCERIFSSRNAAFTTFRFLKTLKFFLFIYNVIELNLSIFMLFTLFDHKFIYKRLILELHKLTFATRFLLVQRLSLSTFITQSDIRIKSRLLFIEFADGENEPDVGFWTFSVCFCPGARDGCRILFACIL